MEFAIALVHFLAVSFPLLVLFSIAAIGYAQPFELGSQGQRDFITPEAAVWMVLSDDAQLRLWAGQTNGSSVYAVERGDKILTLSRGNASGSFRETWTITLETQGSITRVRVAQAVYARSALYRGAMRLFFPPSADYERLLVAIENHLGVVCAKNA